MYQDLIQTDAGMVSEGSREIQTSPRKRTWISVVCDPGPADAVQSVFQLGREKDGVQKKLGTIERTNDQNSGTI